MALRGTALLVLAGLSSATFACSSSSDSPGKSSSSSKPSETSDTSAADSCNPNDPKIPCFKDKAEPCKNPINTGFPGDDLCLDPPKDGFQLHVGPSDYTDPDEITKWTLPPGGFPGQGPDINFCYYMKTPNDTDIYTSEYYAHMRPGSHHYIMFGVANGNVPDSTGPDSCAARDAQIAGGANFLSGATREVQNATMFGDAPEDTGLGSPIEAHKQLNMNLHFVNITDQPVLEELWVNMIEKPADEVSVIVKAIEWLGGLTMNIPPHQDQLLQAPSGSCTGPSTIPDGVRILGVTAHMHANTVRVSMYHQAPGASDKELIFDDFNWSEPTVWLFNSKITNPMPNRDALMSGAPKSGDFNVGPQDQFTWECQVDNQTDSTLTFSDKAYTGEMCNIFGMYASPKATDPWLCYF
ncbi:MAG TPA: hypothetical protein VHC69_06060 [Polyangiaceae bacterium]|nr:hypothetical protein [Polyangiaceae bacterium]